MGRRAPRSVWRLVSASSCILRACREVIAGWHGYYGLFRVFTVFSSDIVFQVWHYRIHGVAEGPVHATHVLAELERDHIQADAHVLEQRSERHHLCVCVLCVLCVYVCVVPTCMDLRTRVSSIHSRRLFCISRDAI